MTSLIRPSWKQGFARHDDESEAPGRWKALQGHWSPPLGVTATLHDVSRRKNNGTFSGPTWVRSERGQVLQFPGSTEYVNVPDNLALRIVNPFTLSFWANITDPLAAGTIISKFGADKSGVRCEAGTVMHITENTTNVMSVAESEFVGAWHWFTITNDASGSEIFIDGISKDTGNTLVEWFSLTGPLRFGAPEAAFFGSGTDAFDGLLGTVAIHSRVLPLTEIQQHYADPDATLRLRRIVPVAVPIVVGGLSIPVAMHHYTKNILAGR